MVRDKLPAVFNVLLIRRRRYTVCGFLSYNVAILTYKQSVRKDFIVPVNKERRSMVGNIILYFSILSSAFRLKSPLPPYLPPAEKSREELVRPF